MNIEKTAKSLGDISRNVVIGLAILILTSFVAVYGMNTFVDRPIYEDYCPDVYVFSEETSCLQAGGEWQSYDIKTNDSTVPAREGSCVPPKACYTEYDKERESYSKVIFFISVPLGILIIILGAFVFSLGSVGIGVMLGGVYTLIYGAASYWTYGEDWARFLISLVGLIAIILVAYRFNRKK